MDNVSDGLIRIKNGYMAHLDEVVLNYSKITKTICDVLEKEGYIANCELIVDPKNDKFQKLKVSLKYEGKRPAITHVKRVSKPGLRVYKGKASLPWVLNGLGIAIISTPSGVMTDKQARKAGLGGEVMAYVW